MTKRLWLVALFLVACSGTPTDKNGNPITQEAADSMYAAGEEPQQAAAAPAEATPNVAASETPLSTPVEGELSQPTPSVDASTAPVPTPAEVPAPIAKGVPEIPPSENSPVLPPTAPKKDATQVKNTYELFEEHQAAEGERAALETEWEKRALFFHEGGAWQLGVDATLKAFPNYDFDPSSVVKTFDNKGGSLSFMYFPLRSLTFGRLGVGATAGMYVTKFSFLASFDQGRQTKTDTNTVRSFTSYGARVKYEFQYFLGQFVVPFAFFGYDKVRVKGFKIIDAGVNYPEKSFDSQALGFGASLNLNRLEPSSANRALVSSGVKKYYLTYTFEGRSDSVNSGTSHLLGLRFEY